MAIFKSKHTVDAPATNLLTYLLSSPFKEEGAWPATESLLTSSNGQPAYTIEQIKTLVKRLGQSLYQLGARGRKVIIYGDGNIHFPLVMLGIIAAGGTVNIRPQGEAQDLANRLRELECDIVFFSPGARETVVEAAREAGVSRERIFVVDEFLQGQYQNGGLNDERKVRHWSALFDTPEGDDYQWPELSPEESKSTTAVLFDTSGTTGLSKLVERTHHSLIGNIAQVLQHYTLRPRDKEITFCNYRVCGMGYLLLGLLIPLKARYKTIFAAQVDTDTFIATVENMKPTWVMAPKHLMRDVLLRKPEMRGFETVRHVLTGGAIIPFELIDEWQGAFGGSKRVQVQSVYGMSEGGFFTIPHPDDPVQDDTTGILLPSVEAKIQDDNGKLLSTNEKGNVFIRTPFAMKGYLGDPKKTAETIMKDGWIRTDDVGWIDDREQLYIAGRRKDIFKVQGYNVTSSEIESAITQHPGVRDVAVIAVTLPNESEAVPRGYIVRTAESASTLTAEEFTSWMQKEIHPHLQLVGGVAFIESIPISAGGNNKVDRQKLLRIAEDELKLQNGKH
ncbi:uncharacterized protein BDV14DRAFT_175223 [Aspergillus stella-maris]|uniref:uncharacterized protein n=1 Tax=Aspergillus stella-maris TaxID=1810926 RepID=UPI003CCCA0F4